MAQEFEEKTSPHHIKGVNKNVAIIGAGASGCICAYYLLKSGIDVTLFDFGSPLRTLLPTGGGRCNLAHAQYDFKELAKNYPRGEKFLYSVFSKFSTYDTLSLFEELGVETYVQEDDRIFPTSNSAKDVRENILEKIKKANFFKEKVSKIEVLDNGFKITTAVKANDRIYSRDKECQYLFNDVVVATGGRGSKEFLKKLNHNIIPEKPSLVGLNSETKVPPGIVIKNVYSKDFKINGDILFTHFGISGPLTYKISSIKARDSFPYKLSFDLYPLELPLQDIFNSNPHKEVKNILSKYLPLNFVKYILVDLGEVKAHRIDGKTRDLILDKIHNFELKITGTNKGDETVTAGGIDLKEVNPKTMESKIYPHLYFAGEVLDIDGFCGGFNLQNAWSTAYIAAESILSN